MREAIGESNTVIITIILLAIFITGATVYRNNLSKSIKKSNSINCSKYGYSYDAKSKKCMDVNGHKFKMPGIGN